MASKSAKQQLTLTVFLGLQFKSDYYDRSEIVSTIENAVEMAEADLRKKHPGLTLQLIHRIAEGKPLNAEIVQQVRDATAAVFEVSEQNANVYFELGLAYATGIEQPILLYNTSASKRVAVASDVRDLLRINYSKEAIGNVEGRIAKNITQMVAKRLTAGTQKDTSDVLKSVWSVGASAKNINIVCPELPSSYRPKYAKAGSPEFVNLARFGDLDALAEVLRILPQFYPNANVKYVTSNELNRDDRRGNLIVIGGPDFNSIAATLHQDGQFPIQYRTKGEDAFFQDIASGSTFRLEERRGRIVTDYGLFARFPNPMNARSTIILIGGLQTFGVLGAVEAFGVSKTGRDNARQIVKRCTGSAKFAVLIPVKVSSGQPSIAKVDVTTFHAHPWK